MTRLLRLLPVAATLLTGGCYDYAQGYAPTYPAGYDSGMGSGQYTQPGDRFGGQDVASIDVFFEPLAQYGGWVDSRFGRAFRPNVPADWRPYVNGRWGENRLWLSDDPWGWATDHYGRWGHDEREGWVWLPGTQWAPSWVAWREDETQDVAGWAPIPPGIQYSIGVGFGSGFGYDSWDRWYAPSWVWVPRPYLYRPGFGGAVLPWNHGRDYWRGSRWDYRADYHRPGAYAGQQGRPGGWNGQPGRPDHGNRPPPTVSDAIAGGIAGTPPRGRGNGQWHGNGGRPGLAGDGRPGNGNPGGWQGYPRPGYNGGQSRPSGVGDAIAGGLSQPRPAGSVGRRPPESFGQRQPGSFEQRPPESFGQRQPGSFGQRPPESFGQRPPESFGQRQPGSFGQRSPESFGQRQPGSFRQRPPESFEQRPPGVYGQRPPGEAQVQARPQGVVSAPPVAYRAPAAAPVPQFQRSEPRPQRAEGSLRGGGDRGNRQRAD